MSAELYLGVAIGMICAFLAVTALVWMARSRPAAERQNLDDANGLLRDRNTIGEIHGVHFKHISDGIRNLNIPRRERIAVQALQGYLAGRMNDPASMKECGNHHSYVATGCLKYTDALIAALDGKEQAS